MIISDKLKKVMRSVENERDYWYNKNNTNLLIACSEAWCWPGTKQKESC